MTTMGVCSLKAGWACHRRSAATPPGDAHPITGRARQGRERVNQSSFPPVLWDKCANSTRRASPQMQIRNTVTVHAHHADSTRTRKPHHRASATHQPAPHGRSVLLMRGTVRQAVPSTLQMQAPATTKSARCPGQQAPGAHRAPLNAAPHTPAPISQYSAAHSGPS